MIFSRVSNSLIFSQTSWTEDASPVSNEVWMFDLLSNEWFLVLEGMNASYSDMNSANLSNRPPNDLSGEFVMIEDQIFLLELGSEEKWTLSVCMQAAYLSNSSFLCNACDSGRTSPGASYDCYSCPIATFLPDASKECVQCPAGTYGNDSALSSCFSCPSGSYSENGQSDCAVCEAGTFSNRSSSSCSDCDVGFHSSENGQEMCTPCSSGYFAEDVRSTLCLPCDSGRYSNASSQYCTSCLPGSASPNYTLPCALCPVGTFSVNEGTAICFPCEAGRYSSNDGLSSCEFCTSGFYGSESYATICTSCPRGSSSQIGSIALSQCVCPEGFYGTAYLGQACSPCRVSSGISCGKSNLSLPIVQNGFFRVSADRAMICIPKEACEFTGENETTPCSQGYTGENCGDCIRFQYYRKGVGCQKCPSKVILGLQITAILLAITLCLWSFTRSESGLTSEVKILFQALQLIGTFPSLNLQFPPALIQLSMLSQSQT
jgi:hypothetical protein